MQRAYWDLVFALRSLQVQRDAVSVARTQLEHNKRLVNEGQLAPIDVVAAEAQISTYEQRVFGALEEVSRSENNLKNLIAQNQKAELWNESIVPTDPVDLAVPDVSLPDALKTAMENRPELQQSNVLKEINQIDQRYLQRSDEAGGRSRGHLRRQRSGGFGQHCNVVNPLTASSLAGAATCR